MTNIWVVNNTKRGYVTEVIERKIYKRVGRNIIKYKNKQHKLYVYQPGNRKSQGYCIFPQGLPSSLKEYLRKK